MICAAPLLWESRHPQMRAAAHLSASHFLETQRCSLNRFGIGLGLLDAGYERTFQVFWQIGKYRLPGHSTDPDFYLLAGNRQRRFIDYSYRVLAIILDP